MNKIGGDRYLMPDTSLFDITGKKALITGGSLGIGRACATALALNGADVAVVSRTEKTAMKTVESLRDIGSDSIFIPCDVSDEQQVESMMHTFVDYYGRLDIAVNSAGIARGDLGGGPDESFPKEDWDKIIAVNLTGVWLCAKAQARQFIQQQPASGKIINIASMAAATSMIGNPAAYDASKAGIVHLTRSLAVQWGKFNININCLSSSYVMTSLMERIPLRFRDRVRETTPMGYMQRSRDIYGPIQFLASSAADYVTGQNLLVDGGHTLSTYIRPLKRDVPPRYSEADEIVELKEDYDILGIPYDENGVRVS